MSPALERLNKLIVKSREKTPVANPFTKQGFVEVPTAESMETAITIGMDYAPALIAALVEIEALADYDINKSQLAKDIRGIINHHLEPPK